MGLLAVDFTMVVIMLAERPVLGASVAAVAAVAYGQKHLVRTLHRA